jgi:putative transposase
MKAIKFVTNVFYHVYNRGTDSREIFCGEKDYLRFVHSLYEFNDRRFALPYCRIFKEELIKRRQQRKPLVNIICFCLMPNHFHLVLEQLEDGGITKFMRKLGTGYTMYFNKKYERSGVLFQGKFKAIRIEREEYLLHLCRYIHLNPLRLIRPDWKERGVGDCLAARYFLERYRWSSFIDCIGGKNFPSVIHADLLRTYFGTPEGYREFTENFFSGEKPYPGEIFPEVLNLLNFNKMNPLRR